MGTKYGSTVSVLNWMDARRWILREKEMKKHPEVHMLAKLAVRAYVRAYTLSLYIGGDTKHAKIDLSRPHILRSSHEDEDRYSWKRRVPN